MHEATRAFIERMGLVSETYGLPRIAGRMIGFFLMDGRCRSLDELSELLDVSKASVSTNARILESAGLLERRTSTKDRRDYYQLGDRPWENMFAIARKRLVELGSVVGQQLDTLPPELENARDRLESWQEFHAFMVEDLDRKIDHWKQRDTSKNGMEAKHR